MPKMDWIFLALFMLALAGLVGLAEIVRRLMHWSTEATRKIVHILAGVMVATTPFVLQSMWPMIILGIVFTILDYYAVRHNLFHAMHGGQRQTYGTVFYPLSFIILTATLWQHDKLVLVTSMLVMALADAAAAIVGEHVKKPRVLRIGSEQKSVQGSIAMFLVSWLIIAFCLLSARRLGILDYSLLRIFFIALIVSIIAMLAEVLSTAGSDNLSVPLGSAFALYFLLHASIPASLVFAQGMGIAIAIAILSWRLHFLSGSGSVALVLLGTLVFGVGGWTFSAPILIFFILSSLLSKIGKKRKAKLLNVFEKSGTRDAGQVLANGGVAGLMLVFWYFSQNGLFYIAYIASLAAVTADTWATELGVLARGEPRSIITFKKVPMGTSGGVSFIGTLGALIGSAILSLSGILFSTQALPGVMGWPEVVLVLVVGLLASMVDSLLGATIQAQYQCPICSKVTEKHLHCDGAKTRFFRGVKWINNDVVNSLCAFSGVLFILALWRLLG